MYEELKERYDLCEIQLKDKSREITILKQKIEDQNL
jgi:hypothetical protein